jgi:quercetin 2,3-dioxygenase
MPSDGWIAHLVIEAIVCSPSGDRVTFKIGSDRVAWIQVGRSIVTLNGESLREGDGVQINSPELLELTTKASAEILLFDLA